MPWGWTFAGIIGDERSTKIAKRIVVRWRLTFLRQGQVCFPMHLYGKNLQKSSSPKVKTFKNLLLQNRECLGAEPLQESSGTGGLPTLLKELSYVDIWPFYRKVKFASLCICMGKTFKNLLLQNLACLMAESLHISSGTGELPKLLK